jgi:hypothetical protein
LGRRGRPSRAPESHSRGARIFRAADEVGAPTPKLSRIDSVVAGTPGERVVSQPTNHIVVSAAAVRRVVAAEGEYLIAGVGAVECIGFLGAFANPSTARALDRRGPSHAAGRHQSRRHRRHQQHHSPSHPFALLPFAYSLGPNLSGYRLPIVTKSVTGHDLGELSPIGPSAAKKALPRTLGE